MDLNPLVLFHELRVGVFGFCPLNETASSEARRVNGEVTFHALQRQAADFDQFFEKRRQGWILKVTRNRIVVRRSRQKSLAVRVSQVRAKATARERGVNLERAGEDHIGQGQARTPKGLDRLLDAFAEFIEQGKKAFLLVSLRPVIGRPFLLSATDNPAGVDQTSSCGKEAHDF